MTALLIVLGVAYVVPWLALSYLLWSVECPAAPALLTMAAWPVLLTLGVAAHVKDVAVRDHLSPLLLFLPTRYRRTYGPENPQADPHPYPAGEGSPSSRQACAAAPSQAEAQAREGGQVIASPVVNGNVGDCGKSWGSCSWTSSGAHECIGTASDHPGSHECICGATRSK